MIRLTEAAMCVALFAGVTHAVAEPDPTSADFLGAVERVVEAIGQDDYETFETYFSENTRGLQPDQLWEGAFRLLRKFGPIEKIEFKELDEGSGGGFVTVTFERSTRDVFVRLSKKTGKIRELTYVPPTNVHGSVELRRSSVSIRALTRATIASRDFCFWT